MKYLVTFFFLKNHNFDYYNKCPRLSLSSNNGKNFKLTENCYQIYVITNTHISFLSTILFNPISYLRKYGLKFPSLKVIEWGFGGGRSLFIMWTIPIVMYCIVTMAYDLWRGQIISKITCMHYLLMRNCFQCYVTWYYDKTSVSQIIQLPSIILVREKVDEIKL